MPFLFSFSFFHVMQVTTLAGKVGEVGSKDGVGSKARFDCPCGIAADGVGNLYVCEGYRVRKVTSKGEVTTVAGCGTEGNVDGKALQAKLGGLRGICVDKRSGATWKIT